MISIAKERNEHFINQFEFPRITAEKKQNYLLRFYIFMLCIGNDKCSNSDYMSVQVSFRGRTVKESEFEYQDMNIYNKWTIRTMELRSYAYDSMDVRFGLHFYLLTFYCSIFGT